MFTARVAGNFLVALHGTVYLKVSIMMIIGIMMMVVEIVMIIVIMMMMMMMMMMMWKLNI